MRIKKTFTYLNVNTLNAKGFALIATISLLSLILFITMALVSLSTITTKTSGYSHHIGVAKANARMALAEALSQLQASMGPDMRVSAEGDIIATCDDSKRHYVGVYNTENWHSRDSDGMPLYFKKYEADRNTKAFERYLVSGSSTDVENIDYVKTALSGETIELVGVGTVGPTLTAADRVSVPLVNISGGGASGSYGWWIGDEGVKMNYALVDQRTIDPDDDAKLSRYRHMNPEQAGINSLTNLSGLDHKTDAFKDDLYKVVTRQTTEVHTADNSALDVEGASLALRKHYHDVTVSSQSVLASTARAGLKRDLSLAFELPDVEGIALASSSDHTYSLIKDDDHTLYSSRSPTFDEIWEFGNSGDTRSSFVHGRMVGLPESPTWWNKKLGYVYNYPNPSPSSYTNGSGSKDYRNKEQYLRGPSWSLLRNHYRHYKREYEKLDATDALLYTRRGVKLNPTADDRTFLSRPYLPYSSHGSSGGTASYSEAYVGDMQLLTHNPKVVTRTTWDPFYIYTDAMRRGDRPWLTRGLQTYGLNPVITKVGMVLSVYGHKTNDDGDTQFALCMDMVGTVWNPYNVSLECNVLFTQLEFTGIRWDLHNETTGEHLATDDTGYSSFGSNKIFPFRFVRLGVTEGGTERPTTNWVLKPGEVRTFTLSSSEPETYVDDESNADFVTPVGKFSNNWDGGMIIHPEKWVHKNNDTLTFKFRPSGLSGKNDYVRMRSFLGYLQNLKGASRNPFDANQTWSSSTGNSLEDMPEVNLFQVSKSSDIFKDEDGNAISELEVSINSIDMGADSKKPVAYFEFRRKTTDVNEQNSTSRVGLGYELDPRSIVNHSRASSENNGSTLPFGWEVVMKGEGLEIEVLQAGKDETVAGGTVKNAGYFGAAHDGSGSPKVVMFELPDAPVTNAAMLASAQLGPTAFDVPFAIGGSAKHFKVAKNELIKEEIHGGANTYQAVFADSAYMVNTGIWDNYFFSGVELPADTTPDNSVAKSEEVMKKFMNYTNLSTMPHNPLKNRRLSYYNSGNTKDAILERLTHYRWMARHMMLEGGFNVNSTSVEAWKALLSSLKGKAMKKVDNTGDISDDTAVSTKTPFSRLMVSGGAADQEWLGYASLTEPQIQTLAEKIVDEVRTRGPFLSVADFVNRRLTTGDTGDAGAIQAALEKASLNTGTGREKGIPGTIRQNDVLASIGGVITARSDTFVIRAYGNSKDGDDVIAEAYCEAVVQRVPALVDDNGKLIDMPNPDYDDAGSPAHIDPYMENTDAPSRAKTLGRKFIVKKFKWLKQSEI